MMDTTIALLTRYNVRVSYGDGRDVNDPSWLSYRRRLFETFCAPSVRAQASGNLTWYVLVDDELPVAEERRLAEISGATILRAESHGHAVGRLRLLLSGRRRLLTARLDSDDSLAPTYLETMRAEADRHLVAPGAALAVRMATGVMHDVQGDAWTRRTYPHGPFAGLLEDASAGPPDTILKHAHYDLHRNYVTSTLATAEPMWCIRVHGENVANELTGEITEPVSEFTFVDSNRPDPTPS